MFHVMSSRLFLVLSLSFLCLVTGRTEGINSASTLVRTVRAIESLVNAASPQKSSHEPSQKVDDALEEMDRQRRFGESSPYTSNPYDLGPIGQCSYPQLDLCHFPYGYTVPESVAREASNYHDMYNHLRDVILTSETTSCLDAMMDYVCKQDVAPQCISNTTVRYPSNPFKRCIEAVSRCPRLQAAFGSLCKGQASLSVTGDFSLSKCRVPKVDSCDNSNPSPDWSAARMENLASVNNFTHWADSLNLGGDCKDRFLRLACTNPTCESTGRLRGYKSSDECNVFLSCFPDRATRNFAAGLVLCDAVGHLDSPSAYAGRRGPPALSLRDPQMHYVSGDTRGSSGRCGTACIVGIVSSGAVVAVAVIVVIVVMASRHKKKTPSIATYSYRRLENESSDRV